MLKAGLETLYIIIVLLVRAITKKRGLEPRMHKNSENVAENTWS